MFLRFCFSSLKRLTYILFGDDDDKSLSHRAKLHLRQFDHGSQIGYVSSRKLYQNGYSIDAINSEIESGPIDPLILTRKLLLVLAFL